MTWQYLYFHWWSREDVQVNQRLVSECCTVLERSYNYFAVFAIL